MWAHTLDLLYRTTSPITPGNVLLLTDDLRGRRLYGASFTPGRPWARGMYHRLSWGGLSFWRAWRFSLPWYPSWPHFHLTPK